MTSVKDQYKLLKDIGKGVTEGAKKVYKEAIFLPEAVKGTKKIVNTVKSKIKKEDK